MREIVRFLVLFDHIWVFALRAPLSSDVAKSTSRQTRDRKELVMFVKYEKPCVLSFLKWASLNVAYFICFRVQVTLERGDVYKLGSHPIALCSNV